jgi:polyhydroxyalkanoate synthase
MEDLVAELSRNVDRARNGFKYFIGAEKIEVGITPKETVWSYDKVQLFRYRNQKVLYSTPILLVMSLISRSYVLDLRPNKSLDEYVTKRGFDVFLVDWGVPDGFEADNSLETYTDEYLTRAVENVIRISGAESVTLYGYCLGGDLALLYAASHPEAPIRNLVTMATPVNFSGMGPTMELLKDDKFDLQKLLGWDGNVPAVDIANSFKLLKPTGDMISRANLIENLWDDEFMDGYLAMSRWTGEHIPFPGRAFLQIVD